MNRLTLILSLAMSIIPASLAQDPGWPRELTHQGARLVYYQPQVDEWKDFKDLSFRMAFCLTPAGGKEVVGVVSIHALADVSVDDRNVAIHNLTIMGITFPSLDPATAQTMDRLARAFLDPAKTVTMSLDRLVAC